MTDNDIIKALECCCNAVVCDDNCPLKHKPSITDCNKEFLDLINRQKEHIELLDIEHKAIKTAAVKELGEMLKERIRDNEPYYFVINEESVNDLVEEMVGEINE